MVDVVTLCSWLSGPRVGFNEDLNALHDVLLGVDEDGSLSGLLTAHG